MAIFYEHIKGLASGDVSSESTIFQYLKWQTHNTDQIQSNLPKFLIKVDENTEDYEHLVVSGNINQTLKGQFTFVQTPIFNTGLKTNTSLELPSNWKISVNKNNLLIQNIGTPTKTPLSISNSGIGVTALGCSGNINVTNGGNITVQKTDNNNGNIVVNGGNINVNNSGNIVVSGHIEATYFNATSDKRLKTNLQPLPSVLSFVCSTPIYSFNYTQTNQPSIGVMAQDVDAEKYGDFKLTVADAEIGYLSVHESKFVYVLWKAIQEQQEEIDQLKAELNKLKKTEN